MTDDRTDRTVWRVRALAVCAALVALAFFQSPGLLVDDGMLGLALDPTGTVQTWWRTGTTAPEAPAAPFFLLAWLLGLPAWSAQRLWWAALLCLAFAGLVALARRWGIGTGTSRLVAGAAYALSPGVLVALGGSSVDALPIAAAPWLVLGLIRAGRRWRGAAYAGLAAAATVWWVWAHEPAARGAGVADPVTVLRGMADPAPWLDAGDGPQPGSWQLATATPLVAATVLMAALGLAGLARRGMPRRRLLATAATVGLALVGLGHVGLLWPVPGGVLPRGILPGGGGHLFDVVLRLPLMLGLAHLLGLWTRAVAAHGGLRRAPAPALLAVTATVATIAVATAPALTRDLAPRNGFPAVPGYWQEAASWLAEHAGAGRVLVAPGARSPEYVWGSGDVASIVLTGAWVGDATAGEPWRRTLDAALSSGAGDPWLAEQLASNGVRYVLVRNDLAYARAGAPRPVLVAQALDRSPGLRLVAEFGPDIGIADSFVDGGLAVPLPALRVYRVDAEPPQPAPVVSDAEATVTYRGIRAVSASSWWPLPGATGEAGFVPFAAVDGDPATSWRPAPDVPPERQWVEVSLERGQVLPQLSVAFDPGAGALPTWLAVTADGRQTLVETHGEQVEIELPGRPTRTVRLTVLETRPVGTGGTVGIAEIAIPGVTAQRTLELPEPGGAAAATILLRAAPGTAGCLLVDDVPRCSPATPAPDGTTIDRVVRLPAAASYTAALWAQPRPGSALDALLDRVLAGPTAPAVTASSTLYAEPAARPGAVLDGDPATAWWPSTMDSTPWLRFSWPEPRLLTGLRIDLAGGAVATRPTAVTVVADGAQHTGTLRDGALLFDQPLWTANLSVFPLDEPGAVSYDPYRNRYGPVPVAIGDITFLPDAPASRPSPATPVPLACGSGPTLTVDGHHVPTRLVATLGDLVARREVPVVACGEPTMTLAAGEHRIVATPSDLAAPTRVLLVPPGAPAVPVPEAHPAAAPTGDRTGLIVGAGLLLALPVLSALPTRRRPMPRRRDGLGWTASLVAGAVALTAAGGLVGAAVAVTALCVLVYREHPGRRRRLSGLLQRYPPPVALLAGGWLSLTTGHPHQDGWVQVAGIAALGSLWFDVVIHRSAGVAVQAPQQPLAEPLGGPLDGVPAQRGTPQTAGEREQQQP